jgi:redox-sensitive bicupin YhaK (pirin superfamily)
MDTKHPHRGFDNLWYLLAGEASTGHSTGPGGAMERARLQTGSLLKLRTGIGEAELREGKAGTEMRGI